MSFTHAPGFRFLLISTVVAWAAVASAQTAVSGTVVDESGGAIAGARVTVLGTSGTAPHTVTTEADGTFVLPDVTPGARQIEVRHPLFDTTLTAVTARAGAPALRLVLSVAGLSERLVVTGRRAETRLSETPQTIEVVEARDIARSVATDMTDLLKKNAGIDVVQYSGALSGIGIRGFRPETSGINKRSLLLVDGRPSGVTNLATLLLDGVDHVEVLKGPASAVYGASAMGGVVNVITRRSRGPLSGQGRIAIGSFDALELGGAAGGSLGTRVDFDVNGSAFDQGGNFRMGNGVVRPATTYKTWEGSARLGVTLADAWRAEGRVDAYRGRDINTPGDVFSGTGSQGRKNLERGSQDMRLSGQLGTHLVSAVFYHTREEGHTTNVTTSNPLDQGFLPYLTFENAAGWTGAQVKDVIGWRAHSLVVGLDLEHVTSESRSYDRTGARQAPFSADNQKNTIGLYAENTFTLRGGRTVLSAGGRLDRLTVRTVATPLKTNFTPSTTAFTVFNPSVGIKQTLVARLRAHATAGRAFVPADASALTGYTTNVIGGRTQINQGNPDLRPEHSVSVDGGLEWLSPATHVDVTLFRTQVTDRVVSNIVISNPPPPAPIVLSTFNTLASHISGLDADVSRRLSSQVSVFSTITHYFSRKEELPTTGERNILNVATNTVRAGVDLDLGMLSARVSARYVQGRQDQDFNVAGSPVVDYPSFTVADLSATWQIHPRHAVTLTVNNLFDTFYYEKKGYPLPGASFSLRYRIGR